MHLTIVAVDCVIAGCSLTAGFAAGLRWTARHIPHILAKCSDDQLRWVTSQTAARRRERAR